VRRGRVLFLTFGEDGFGHRVLLDALDVKVSRKAS
jgi:hypothetical protein